MADKCPTCNQVIQANGTPERTYVQIPSADAFRDLCHLLLKSPNCTDEKFIGALADFPKALVKYGKLTTGQWKFFCAIHKQVFGTWPPNAEDIVEQVRKAESHQDLDDIPF